MTLLDLDFDRIRTSAHASPEPTARAEPADRYPHQLVTYLAGSSAGRVILDALLDDDVTEVYVNSDRKVWKETYSAGPVFTR